MGEDNLKNVVEALLFSTDRPITLEQIKQSVGVDIGEIRKAISELTTELETSSRGMRVVEIAGGFQMITAPNFSPFLKKFYKSRKMEKLSKPALETLAMVAYKQPVSKMEIESLRGVNVDGVIKSLTDKGLIRITGRRKAPGRPFVYGTTRLFMEYFGLKSLEELPKIENFKIPAEMQQEVEPLTQEEAISLSNAAGETASAEIIPNTGEKIDESKEPAPAN